MNKILMVSCEGLGNGGVQNVMMNIVRGLSSEFVFDMLLFTSEKRYFDDEFLGYGGQIFRLPRYEGNIWIRKKADYYIRGSKLYNDVKKILINEGPYSAVHCNNEYEGALILKAANEVGVPVRIMHAHVISKKGNFVANVLNDIRRRNISKYSTNRIGCSIEACNSFFGKSSNSSVVYNPFDDRKFNNTGKAKGNGLNLIQIGSFTSNKNQLFTLEIISKIKKRGLNVHLDLIGFEVDNYKQKLDGYINENELQQNVKIWPSNADSKDLLEHSYALMLPSKEEGFGIVAIEAQAVGIKCYVSDSVPKTTNCGGCTYLSLNKGTSLWSDYIIDDYMKQPSYFSEFDVSKFKLSNVLSVFRTIYGGNK